jgi:hypothetical protein
VGMASTEYCAFELLIMLGQHARRRMTSSATSLLATPPDASPSARPGALVDIT